MNNRDAVERNKKPIGALEIPENFNCYYLNKKDRQMRFNNAKDPLYYIFDGMEQKPMKAILKDFVKDIVGDVKKYYKKLASC